MNPLAIRRVVGIIGNVISFGLFLSPLPTFVRIIKNKAVEDFSAIPYLATWLNCAVWDLYGMPFVSPKNTLIYTINGIGIVLESIYLIIFLVNAPRRGRLKVLGILAGEIVFMVVVVAIVVGAIHEMAIRMKVVGIMAVVFGTCMYASPLSVMKMVIETKSVEYMPFTLSLASFVNGLCWTAYALLHFDIFVIIPNGLGALFGLVQLVLYAIYYKSTPKKETSKAELQMQGGQPKSTVAAGAV